NEEKAAGPKMAQKAALNGLASVAYMLGSHEQSLQYFNQCLMVDEKDEACLKNRVLAYLQLGKPGNALSDAIKLTEEYPLSIEYKYFLAASFYQLKNGEAALHQLQEIASRTLDNQQVMHLLGLVLLKKKAYLNSLFFLKQSNVLLPDTIEYQLALAAAYYKNSQPTLTEEILGNIFNSHSLINIIKTIQQNDYLDSETLRFIENRLASMIKNNPVHHEPITL
ncbi:MAG: hypothetical protein D3923_14765, partial [Candidatus Electrothrix sp. AR3]|nr:hypothetical protein [Candidatus Electrothrix sp. AR3]